MANVVKLVIDGKGQRLFSQLVKLNKHDLQEIFGSLTLLTLLGLAVLLILSL